jgi:chromosome segregation ATPase
MIASQGEDPMLALMRIASDPVATKERLDSITAAQQALDAKLAETNSKADALRAAEDAFSRSQAAASGSHADIERRRSELTGLDAAVSERIRKAETEGAAAAEARRLAAAETEKAKDMLADATAKQEAADAALAEAKREAARIRAAVKAVVSAAAPLTE